MVLWSMVTDHKVNNMVWRMISVFPTYGTRTAARCSRGNTPVVHLKRSSVGQLIMYSPLALVRTARAHICSTRIGDTRCFSFAAPVHTEPLRLTIMRSDSELLLCIFRSEKRMGLLMQSDFLQNPTGQNLIWDSDDPSRDILAQNPMTRPIGLSNRKMASVLNQVKI